MRKTKITWNKYSWEEKEEYSSILEILSEEKNEENEENV